MRPARRKPPLETLIVAVAAFLSALGGAAVSGGSFASMFLGALLGVAVTTLIFQFLY